MEALSEGRGEGRGEEAGAEDCEGGVSGWGRGNPSVSFSPHVYISPAGSAL